MSKLYIYLTLTITMLVILPISLHSQVTIGSGISPNKGSLLDLKDGPNIDNVNSTRGLVLPRVNMTTRKPAIGQLAQSIGGTDTWDEAVHAGLTVYNTTNTIEACATGAGIGLYVWNGVEWDALFTKVDPMPTTQIPTDIYKGANSYILSPGGNTINIPIERGFRIWTDFAGNSPATGKVLNLADVNNLTGALAANVVWEEASDASSTGVLDVITPVSISGSGETAELIVKSGLKEGNVLVNVTIGGKVLWQWHIWVTVDDPTQTAYAYNSSKKTYWYMGRYLGATDNNIGSGAYGLYYQWGRSTPIRKNGIVDATVFDSGTAEQVNLTMAIQSDKFISYVSTISHDWYSVSSSQWDSRWGNQNTVSATPKSAFDPCPYGWRVPSSIDDVSPWNCLVKPDGQSYGNGWNFNDIDRNIGYYAGGGYRSNFSGSLGDVGIGGYVWSATPSGAMAGFLYFDSSQVNPSFSYNRANGMSIRCSKE